MADISVMNVGGTDYNIKDSTSRTNSTKAMSLSAYYETDNTASQAYSIVGTPINWKGTLYYTKTTVAKGATWVVGTNLTAATNLGKLVRNIKTYVGSDSKLHFVDLTGADTALNFSSGGLKLHKGTLNAQKSSITFDKDICFFAAVCRESSNNYSGAMVWCKSNDNIDSSPTTPNVGAVATTIGGTTYGEHKAVSYNSSTYTLSFGTFYYSGYYFYAYSDGK